MSPSSLVWSVGAAGVNLDLAAIAMRPDECSNLRNMRSSGTGLERGPGVEALPFTPAFPPKFVMTALNGAQLYIIYMGDAGVHAWDGTADQDITPATGWVAFTAGTMTGCILNGFPCFNTPGVPPWYWNFAADVAPLPGYLANTTANIITAANAHLFSCSTRLSGVDNWERVAWSDAAAGGTVPATWVPTATNQAGDLLLGVGAGPVRAARLLGANLLIYRETGCYSLTYVGRPYIYTARRVSSDVGCASMNGVAEFRGSHVVLAPGDLVLTNGTEVRSIGEGRVKRSLFSSISEEGLKLAHVYCVPGRSEVVFCLPVGRDDACNIAYVWDYERDRWTVRDLPDIVHSGYAYAPATVALTTWDNDAGTWDSDAVAWNTSGDANSSPQAIAASAADVKLYRLGIGDLWRDGSVIIGYAERSGIRIGDGSRMAHITRVWPQIDGAPGDVLGVQIGGQLEASSPVTWGPEQQFVIGQTRDVPCDAMGKFAAWRVSSASALSKWSLQGLTMRARLGGMY